MVGKTFHTANSHYSREMGTFYREIVRPQRYSSIAIMFAQRKPPSKSSIPRRSQNHSIGRRLCNFAACTKITAGFVIQNWSSESFQRSRICHLLVFVDSSNMNPLSTDEQEGFLLPDHSNQLQYLYEWFPQRQIYANAQRPVADYSLSVCLYQETLLLKKTMMY